MQAFIRFVHICELVNKFIIKCCAIFATLLLIVLSCVVFAAVVFRMIVNSPFSWSDEFAKYCMVWLTFIGAPVVAARASHVKVDMLHQFLSPAMLHIIRIFISLFCILILVLFVKYGWHSALAARPQAIVVLNNVSMFWVYVSVPVGSAVFLFSEVVVAMQQALALLQKEPQPLSEQEVK